jgi:hypothetical protein
MKALRCLECKQLLRDLKQHYVYRNGIGELKLEGFCEKCMCYSAFHLEWERFGEGSEGTEEGEIRKLP